MIGAMLGEIKADQVKASQVKAEVLSLMLSRSEHEALT